MSNLVLKYIEKDPVSFIHVKELLNRNYSVIYESEKGFIIRDEDIGFIYMSFNDYTEMCKQLSKTRYDHYIAYDEEIVDFYKDSDKVIKLIQYVYSSNNRFNVGSYDIRILTTDYAEYIDSFYKAIEPGETSYESLKNNNVLGIFENNNLAGIIGRHPEGCMGMLHVLENYRGKGYAEILEKTMINKLIDEKQLVFCEVVDNNKISIHLQNKLGFTQGKKKIYWLV